MKGSQSHGNNYLAQKTHLLVPGQVLELIPARLLFLPLSSVPSGTAARGTTVRVQTNKFPLHMSCLPMAWHADSCQQRGSASVASLVTLQHILSTCRPQGEGLRSMCGLGHRVEGCRTVARGLPCIITAGKWLTQGRILLGPSSSAGPSPLITVRSQ